MTSNSLAAARTDRRGNRRILNWFVAGYPLLYVLGFLSKPVLGPAPIWPAHALAFAAFILLPLRKWPWIVVGMVVWELLMHTTLYLIDTRSLPSPWLTLRFACANILTTMGPAGLARLMQLFRRQDRYALVISPLWIVALFGGALPGALLGSAAAAYANHAPLVAGDIGLWVFAAVLTIVTLGSLTFGLLLGFREPTAAPAKPWEGRAVSLLVPALFAYFAITPWRPMDPLVQPMLFAIPLAWLALRFSRRATSVGVAVVASGIVVFASYGVGIYGDLARTVGWRDVVISIDVFLVIGCGGALLINLMTLKQRMLLDELAREHLALREYARALTVAEETARRKTAADLHDGIGQVLAGQSMTLAAMRTHADQAPLDVLLDEAAEACREAQHGLRVMIQDLTPPGLDSASLEETLRWLADYFKTRFAFDVVWRVNGRAELSRDRLRLIYRCIREFLMNARKHSQRQTAEVEVDLSPIAVELTVMDEGIGFDARRVEPSSGERFGLAQVRERVRAAGGSFDLETVHGEGCRITVRLPAPTPLLA
jgi:signal transduction histidine kinase